MKNTPNLNARFDDIIKDVISPLLKSLGYSKRGLVWNKTNEIGVYSISLQRSHGNSSEHLRFYVNVGAYVFEFARGIGEKIPDDLRKGSPHYQTRFENICDWPEDWIDLEVWSEDTLRVAFKGALVRVDQHLARITSANALAELLRESGKGLNIELFTWWCSSGNVSMVSQQLATARAEFGHEERWPRLLTLFDQVAQKYGVQLQ